MKAAAASPAMTHRTGSTPSINLWRTKAAQSHLHRFWPEGRRGKLWVVQSVSVSNELLRVGTRSASVLALRCIAPPAAGSLPMTTSKWSAPEANCGCTARSVPSPSPRLPSRAPPLQPGSPPSTRPGVHLPFHRSSQSIAAPRGSTAPSAGGPPKDPAKNLWVPHPSIFSIEGWDCTNPDSPGNPRLQ